MSMLVASVRGGLRSVSLRLGRITMGALFLRVVVVALGMGALWVSTPPDWHRSAVPLMLLAVLAVLPGFAPNTWLTLVLELFVIGVWLVWTIGFGEPVTWPRVAALTVLLYGHHISSAWAAAIPLDTVVPAEVWVRWLRRTGAILGVSALLAVVAVGGATLTSDWIGSGLAALVVPVLGIFGAVVIIALLALLARRR